MQEEIHFYRGDTLRVIDNKDGEEICEGGLSMHELVSMGDRTSAGREFIIIVRQDGRLLQLEKRRFSLHQRDGSSDMAEYFTDERISGANAVILAIVPVEEQPPAQMPDFVFEPVSTIAKISFTPSVISKEEYINRVRHVKIANMGKDEDSFTNKVDLVSFTIALNELLQRKPGEPGLIVHYGIRRDVDGMVMGDDRDVIVANLDDRIVVIESKYVTFLVGRSHTTGVVQRRFGYVIEKDDDINFKMASVTRAWFVGEDIPGPVAAI